MDLSSSLTVYYHICYSGVYCSMYYNPGKAPSAFTVVYCTAGPIADYSYKYYVKQRGLVCVYCVIVRVLVKMFKSKYGSTVSMYTHIASKVI